MLGVIEIYLQYLRKYERGGKVNDEISLKFTLGAKLLRGKHIYKIEINRYAGTETRTLQLWRWNGKRVHEHFELYGTKRESVYRVDKMQLTFEYKTKRITNAKQLYDFLSLFLSLASHVAYIIRTHTKCLSIRFCTLFPTSVRDTCKPCLK